MAEEKRLKAKGQYLEEIVSSSSDSSSHSEDKKKPSKNPMRERAKTFIMEPNSANIKTGTPKFLVPKKCPSLQDLNLSMSKEDGSYRLKQASSSSLLPPQ